MTLREYIEENVCDIVDELCQCQHCDDCSIDLFYHGNCLLRFNTIEEVIDKDIEEVQDNDT